MPEIAVEGDPRVPVEEALVLDDVSDVRLLREAHGREQPVVVRADTQERLLEALKRPEVASVLVPEERRELLELDLRELTYGQ